MATKIQKIARKADLNELNRDLNNGELALIAKISSYVMADGDADKEVPENPLYYLQKIYGMTFRFRPEVQGTKLALADFFLLMHAPNKTIADKLRLALTSKFSRDFSEVIDVKMTTDAACEIGKLITFSSFPVIDNRAWAAQFGISFVHLESIQVLLRGFEISCHNLANELRFIHSYPLILYSGFIFAESGISDCSLDSSETTSERDLGKSA